MTKKRFLLRMNARLISIDSKRRNEILNHYRSLIDQSMANGNTEESAIDSFGDINCLSRLILQKEKAPTFVPIIYTVFRDLWALLKIVFLVACICALIFVTGVIITCGYSLIGMAISHFLPSSYLISASLVAALFKIGMCLVIGSVLLIFVMFIKIAISLIIKITVTIINDIKDGIYTRQSTKLMKEAFNIEAIN